MSDTGSAGFCAPTSRCNPKYKQPLRAAAETTVLTNRMLALSNPKEHLLERVTAARPTRHIRHHEQLRGLAEFVSLHECLGDLPISTRVSDHNSEFRDGFGQLRCGVIEFKNKSPIHEAQSKESRKHR